MINHPLRNDRQHRGPAIAPANQEIKRDTVALADPVFQPLFIAIDDIDMGDQRAIGAVSKDGIILIAQIADAEAMKIGPVLLNYRTDPFERSAAGIAHISGTDHGRVRAEFTKTFCKSA